MVAPKKIALAEAEAEFAEVSKLLQEKKDALAEVERRIADLETQFKETTERKEDLQRQVDDCTAKLDRAQKLIGGLGGERDRWSLASDKLGGDIKNVVGDVLIASGVISYMGPFTSDFRERIVRTWIDESCRRKVPRSRHVALPPSLSAVTALSLTATWHSLPLSHRHVALPLCRCRARTSSR